MKLNRLTLVFALALPLVGCSPEAKAKKTMEKYESTFKICKDMTEELKLKPGEHDCALVTSMALDMGLKDSGLEQSKLEPMRNEWLEKSGYKPYYVFAEKRKPEHR